MKKFFLLLIVLCASFSQAQILSPIMQPAPSGSAAIVLDASCTGTGTTNYVACSSAMTVTAGDAITCDVTGVSGGNGETGAAFDSVNGYYDGVFGLVHPSQTSTSWVIPAVMQNSAGGSITPQLVYSATPSTRANISCYAWKNVATSLVMDGGAVTQVSNATATNPTSGTATAPTNNNEVVVACMSRSSSTAPSSGGGAWLPAGTLTLVGSSSVRIACEYQIQTSATAVNGAFTGNGSSLATVDSQLAVLPQGQTGGYRALTGVFVPMGAAGSAPTGTMTAALLGASTSTLSTDNIGASPFWTLTDTTAPTYDTTVNPTGHGRIMVAGQAHTFGDAGSSMLAAGSTTTAFFSATDDWGGGTGTPRYQSYFYQMAGGGSTNQQCDIGSIGGGATDGQMLLQVQYNTGTNMDFVLEPAESGSSAKTANVSTGTDYLVTWSIAGTNQRYNRIVVSGCGSANCNGAGAGAWSVVTSLNYDVLCTNGNHALCTIPSAQATTTGTATSGTNTLTVASGTGTVNGQVVLGAGIPDPSQAGNPAWTMITSGGGTTTLTLSQNVTAPLSSTSVSFYTAPAQLKVATNCTGSTGSTSLTCVAPGTGTITAGYALGGTGILQGTQVSAVSGTGPYTVTTSIPTQSTFVSGEGIDFWNVSGGGVIEFGKNAGGSCGVTANQWFSAPLWDPFGTWGEFEPN